MGPDVENYCDETLKPHQTYGKHVTRKVVCAACREPLGLIICSARHWDPVMNSILNHLQVSFPNMKGSVFEQGFIDQWGTFMDRKEAMLVAKAAGQEIDIERGCGGDSETLYSEGLY